MGVDDLIVLSPSQAQQYLQLKTMNVGQPCYTKETCILEMVKMMLDLPR